MSRLSERARQTSPFSPRLWDDKILNVTTSSGVPAFLAGIRLNPGRLRRLLAQYQPVSGQVCSSVFLRSGAATAFLEGAGPEGIDWLERLSRLGNQVLKSDTGIAGLRAGQTTLVVLPPFPLFENQLLTGWDPNSLLDVLEKEYTVGVVLLRLGRFSVAVYKGETLRASKTDARYVKGRHHAGGTSQKRFERIREGQMHRIFDKACQTVHNQFAPWAGQIEYLLLGGERFTLDGFLKSCPEMKALRPITLARRLNVRDPKRDTLPAVGSMLRESRVWTIDW